MPKIDLAPWQSVALFNPYEHFAMICGIATGKTFTGSHFAIMHFEKYPELTGFIGANSYDQLSHATLRELFYWLDQYGWDYVVDRIPPEEWGGNNRQFKSYKNILTVKNPRNGKVSHAFVRVLQKANPLRGVEFSWYWVDESRDTPLNTHDVILSRMRESEYRRGLVTTTSNAEDWVYQRFVKMNLGKTYGSLHVPTIESVKHGIITEEFYTLLRASYSEMMAAQELDAQHVNVMSGRAYYAASKKNQSHVAPWGAKHPDPGYPLIVGCDFNFSPAPCIWMVGQEGTMPDGRRGIHWFGEIVENQSSTENMTITLINRYPDFFYQCYGDASGTKGSTSNHGETDTVQMAQIFSEYGAGFGLDFDQSNPRVKDRVENMNRMFCNSLGEVSQTYDPDKCPYFDGDIRVVGWKQVNDSIKRNGKLDDTGDKNRTHATDGAGYAIWKRFKPVTIGQTGGTVERAHSYLSKIGVGLNYGNAG